MCKPLPFLVLLLSAFSITPHFVDAQELHDPHQGTWKAEVVEIISEEI